MTANCIILDSFSDCSHGCNGALWEDCFRCPNCKQYLDIYYYYFCICTINIIIGICIRSSVNVNLAFGLVKNVLDWTHWAIVLETDVNMILTTVCSYILLSVTIALISPLSFGYYSLVSLTLPVLNTVVKTHITATYPGINMVLSKGDMWQTFHIYIYYKWIKNIGIATYGTSRYIKTLMVA